jgi:translation elongation factor EF-1beta
MEMLEVYEDLKGLLKVNNVEKIKEGITKILKNIEKGEYLVIDIPFGETDLINILQNEDGETITTDLEEARKLIDDCQYGKLLKL